MSGMDELPIACTLTPDAMADRVAWLRRLGAASLLAGERRGDLLELRFDAAAEDEVRRWVSAEQRCCAFLSFGAERRRDGFRLRVGAPPAAGPLLDELLAALRGG